MSDVISLLTEILEQHGINPYLKNSKFSESTRLSETKTRKLEPLPRRQCADADEALRFEESEQNKQILFNGWYKNLEYFAPLNSEEMISLAKEFEAGKSAQSQLESQELTDQAKSELSEVAIAGKRAFEKMVIFNLRLVRSITLKSRALFPGISIEDTFQAGLIGLLIATEKWDWQRGYAFSTYATNWIKQNIYRENQNLLGIARIPIHQFEGIRWDFLEREWVRDGNTPLSLTVASDHWSLKPPISTEILIEDGSLLFLTRKLPETDQVNENLSRISVIESATYSLNEREKGILNLRFGLLQEEPKTLDEIGKIYGVTRERIRQLESLAFFKVTKSLILDFLILERYRQSLSKFTKEEIKVLELVETSETLRKLEAVFRKNLISKDFAHVTIDKALKSMSFEMAIFD